MSTRWYPLYQSGNPQLRVFLPNFWLKLVKPKNDMPKNIVMFHCSMEMTRFDVKNYLKKIYDVHPIHVNIRIAQGQLRRPLNAIIKDDDIKIAYVILPKTESFTFPELFSEMKDKASESREQFEQMKKNFLDFSKHNKMPGFPSWFRV